MYTTTDMRQFVALQSVNNGVYFEHSGLLKENGDRITIYPLLIEENKTQPTIEPHMSILHTNAGTKPASILNLWCWINNPANTGEPHFQIALDGGIGQFMLVTRRADCNFNANSFMKDGRLRGAISFECADTGAEFVETTMYTNAQLESIISVCTALAVQFGTECGECLTWDSKGIDFHTRHPYINAWTKAWTNVKGKTCPGALRKRQLPFIRAEVSNRVIAYVNKCDDLGVASGIKGF